MLEMADKDYQGMVSFLQDLIRTPSPSTREGPVAARLAEEMRRVGFPDVRVDHIGNVIGRVGSGRGKKLLLNAHMDTVSVADAQDWQHDPFGAEISDGIIYGRGAADMKSALAAMVYAARILLQARVRLVGDLYVVGIVQMEPSEGLAMRVLVEQEGLRPDWVILGEPTHLQVRRGHPGRMEIRVTVHGRSCHASAPQLGENAIDGAARVIVGLEEVARETRPDRGTIAVTQIESSAGSRNVVPDCCSFIIDRRLVQGETGAKALGEVQEVVQRANVRAVVEVCEYHGVSYTGYRAHQAVYHPAWELEESHPLVQAMAQAAGRVMGRTPEIGLWHFSTDGVYTMGEAEIPTVGLGPAEERFTHVADEQVVLEDVATAARVYAELALELLK